jgi:hypothetical protein
VTGQAAWYDLKVRITKAADGEEGVWPAFGFDDSLDAKKGEAS